MEKYLKPKLLIIINSITILLIFLLSYGQFHFIKSYLTEKNIEYWVTYGLGIAIMTLLNFTYAAYALIYRKNVSIGYGFISIIMHIGLLVSVLLNYREFIPTSVPNSMTFGYLPLYSISFLLPSLIYSIFILAYYLTPEDKEQKAWLNYLIALFIPTFGFFLYMFGHSFLSKNVDYLEYIFEIYLLVAPIFFNFFLARSILILNRKKIVLQKKYELPLKILFALVIPVIFFSLNYLEYSHFMGDFSDIWFLYLSILNGVLICFPDLKNKYLRLFLFIARSITYSFTVYLFIVFLPYLPIDLMAIFIFGLGLLLLAPIVLFILHTKYIIKDYNQLKLVFNKRLLISIHLIGFVILPTSMTLNFLNDKKVFDETLEYVFYPNYSKNYELDFESTLFTTFELYSNLYKSEEVSFSNRSIPYISTYFNWLVLKGLVLPERKLNKISEVFFGFSTPESDYGNYFNNKKDDDITISKLSGNSTYDENQRSWKSVVDIELTANKVNNNFGTFTTLIDLPNGCWVSDFYLFINNKKESGVLAEKKSALRNYSQLYSMQKELGILYYLNGDKVELKVFPFIDNVVKKTGIEFIHKEPIELNINGQVIKLGSSKNNADGETKIEEFGNIAYVPLKQKEHLKLVQRKPYLHFLVDVSKNSKKYISEYELMIEKALKEYPDLMNIAQISLVNSYVNTFQITDNWRSELTNQSFYGGFYLDRAIRKSLVEAYQKEKFPIFIVVTENFKDAIINGDYSDLEFSFPESKFFYTISKNGNLIAHSLLKNPHNEIDSINQIQYDKFTYLYTFENGLNTYLPINNMGSIAFNNVKSSITNKDILKNNWFTGLKMQGKWLYNYMHPNESEDSWRNMVEYSFKSKLMNPYSSYFVLEYEFQNQLQTKQKQVLSKNNTLEMEDEIIQKNYNEIYFR